MGNPGKYAPVSMLCVLSFLFLFVVPAIEVTWGAFLNVGTSIPSFTLNDQHGKKHAVNEAVRLVLFCRDKKGQDIISETLKETSEGYLSQYHTFFVADTSGMPRLVAKFIALPALRKRPYVVLLDPGPSVTGDFPSEKDKVTLVYLQNLEIKAIEFVDTPENITKAIEQQGNP